MMALGLEVAFYIALLLGFCIHVEANSSYMASGWRCTYAIYYSKVDASKI